MSFIKFLLKFLSYPVEWFFYQKEKYENENCLWKTILLFIFSLSGLALGVYLLLLSLQWLFVDHIEIGLIIAGIWWLYSYIEQQLNEKKKQNIQDQDQEIDYIQQTEENAKNGYVVLKNILYQTLRSSNTADSLGAIPPRLLTEIETDRAYFIVDRICYYQFQLSKIDTTVCCSWEDLEYQRKILQHEIATKIRAGAFPTLGVQNFIDEFGNVQDTVQIAVIEDVGTHFIIQATFYSPEYGAYLRSKQTTDQNKQIGLLRDEKLDEDLKNV